MNENVTSDREHVSFSHLFSTQRPRDLPELLQRRLKMFHVHRGDHIRIGEVVRGFERFVLEPKDKILKGNMTTRDTLKISPASFCQI